VFAYCVVISTMVALSLSAVAAGNSVWLGVGAVCFFVSDILIAFERFVGANLRNRIAGIPLYFFAQLALIAGFS
jgi:uncharacterized membrane protein YhhN